MDGTEETADQAKVMTTAGPENKHRRQLQMMRVWLYKHRGSLIFLWAPTLITAIYYLLIAASLYASEAKFVVRSASKTQISPLSNILQSTGISRAQDDVYSVNDFITSRDAVKALEDRLPIRKLFDRPEADFLARYPNPLYDQTDEDFHKYYQQRVKVSYDATTGISTVSVQAFRPDDAMKIANLLIEESESLVNKLNERARANAVKDAETDVTLAQQRVIDAQKNVLGYRTREEMLDPSKASGALAETITKLKGELTLTQTRLADLDRSSPDSPLKPSLQSRAAALQRQIDSEQSKLAGRGSSMAPKIPEYEQLMLQQEFAAKGLASAMGSLESAREEARRQQVYLERIVEASKPDKAEFPKRLRSILIVFISCFLAFSTGKLLLAGIREHSQR